MAIPSNKLLEQVLDYSALKQKVIGQNIANANTKNYKRRVVEFNDVLEKSMNSLNKNHSELSEYEVKIDEKSKVVADGNNVDVNKEMADLAENTLMFQFASKKMHSYFTTLQSVIRGGK